MRKCPDTIAAISTPIGCGGIGIVRVSGHQSFAIAKKIAKYPIDLDHYHQLRTRKIIHTFIINQKQEILDEVLLCFMPANKSYTGEMTVEINCHGGRAVLMAILKLVIASGAKLASPGDFTRRAVENNRIDLIQAEAINDIINARSEKGLKIALKHMEGGLSKRYRELRDKLVDIVSEIHAQIDFEVEDIYLEQSKWESKLKEIQDTIIQMLKSSKIRKFMDHGIWIALAGAPNAGKSSLFNAILNIERAIVCDIPGTTRDHISETIEIEGVEVKLTDTAGIRVTNDKIEALSIDRSKQQIISADFILYVIDQSQPITQEEEKEITRLVKEKGLLVLNKKDLKQDKTVDRLIINNQLESLSVSAIKNEGIDELLDKLAEWIASNIPNTEDPIVATMRQMKLLEKATQNIEKAIKDINISERLDIVSYEIEMAIKNLAEIIGEVNQEDIYKRIFSKFCVGK